MLFVRCAFLKVLALNLAFANEETLILASPLDSYTSRTADLVDWQSQISPSIHDFLRNQTAVQTRANGSPTFSIRGSLQADRTTTLYGYAPLQVGDGSGATTVLLGEEVFDSLYIYKGPASLYFGSRASGGAFRFLPARREKNRVRLYAGSFDQYSADLQLNVYRNENHHIQGTYFNESFQNSYNHDNTLGINEGRWRQNLSDWRRASITHFYKNSYSSILYGKKIGFIPPAFGMGVSKYDQSALLLTHYNEKNINNTNVVKGQASYLQTENEYMQEAAFSKANNEIANLVLNIESAINSNFINVLQLQWNQHHMRTQFGSPAHYEHAEVDIGIQQVHRIGELNVEPQIRYLNEYEEWLKGLSISQDQIYISYSEGYRSPTLNALYFENTTSMKNSNLKPEYSSQIEVGYKEQSHQIKIYQIDYDDMFASAMNAGKVQTINKNKAQSRGIELEATYKDTFCDVYGSLNYMKTEDDIGAPLPLSPRLQANLGFNFYYGFFKIQPQIHTWYKYYLLDLMANELKRADNWTTLDLHLFTHGFKDWEIGVGVDNLLEEQRVLDVGYPEPLRKYFVTYKLYF
jgi:outer membrane cobalamin receptor